MVFAVIFFGLTTVHYCILICIIWDAVNMLIVQLHISFTQLYLFVY